MLSSVMSLICSMGADVVSWEDSATADKQKSTIIAIEDRKNELELGITREIVLVVKELIKKQKFIEIHMSRLEKVVVLFIYMAISSQVIGQTFERKFFETSIGEENIKNAYIGGLLSPQFNAVDLNQDEYLDLLVFDRVGDVILTFVNDGIANEVSYTFAPEYISIFPDLHGWVLLRDYNGDGIEDIFALAYSVGIPGIEVYKGQRDNGILSYHRVIFADKQYDILYIPTGNTYTQIYVSNIDYPEVVDIDGDGDLDVLSFEVAGGRIFEYRNQSVEKGYGLDSLIFKLQSTCHGGIFESGLSQEIALSSMPGTCASGVTTEDPMIETRHSGSTISAFDISGNGLLDLVIGDISNPGLVQLSNSGSLAEAWMNEEDINYPSDNVPLNIQVFNTAFFLDVDNDGKKDMIAASNDKSTLQSKDHIWFYKNNDLDLGASLELKQKDFLVDKSLHFGLGSYPCFADVDQDGLIDIIVGTSGKSSTESVTNSRLILLKNIGTKANPRFAIVDEDYLGFSVFSSTSGLLAPSVGDLDGDGDEDMIIGDDVGYLYYLENIAGEGAAFSFSQAQYKYQNIRVGQQVKPAIADLNKDGLGDIVIGERNFNSNTEDQLGSLNYLENLGQIGSPLFDMESSKNNFTFGNVYTKDPGFINNTSHPNILDMGSDFLLFVGTESGKIRLYKNIAQNLDGTFTEESSFLGNIHEGIQSAPAVIDIDNDGMLDILVGNKRGGLAWYGSNILAKASAIDGYPPLGSVEILTIPNPFNDGFQIKISDVGIQNIQIFGANGKKYFEKNGSENEVFVDTKNWISGIYFLKLTSISGIQIQKLIKL